MEVVLEEENEAISPETPVSIVICFKNEEDNIRKNFSSWVNQLSLKDELILVNDYSTDESEAIIKALWDGVKNVRVILPKTDLPGKKQALADGVHAATNGRILLTDADCFLPIGWKEEMNKNFLRESDFILGYAPFYRHEGFLNIFQRFEAMLTAIQYFSYAAAGIPYMGVGRNMGFSKAIFTPDVYGHSKIISGDDDLLVNALATGDNVSLCLKKSTFVYSEAKSNWKDYLFQKQRHATTSVAYRNIHKLMLGLFAWSQIMFHILFWILLFTTFWQVTLLIYVLRLLIFSSEVLRFSKVFHENMNWIWTPLLDFVLSLYYIILGILLMTRKSVKWN